MRISDRQHQATLNQLDLQVRLEAFRDGNDLNDDVEFLRALTFEMREILLDMEPRVDRAEKFSWLKTLIADQKKRTGLTDIEILQALTSLMDTTLKYMLRYERHGDYDKPAGLE